MNSQVLLDNIKDTCWWWHGLQLTTRWLCSCGPIAILQAGARYVFPAIEQWIVFFSFLFQEYFELVCHFQSNSFHNFLLVMKLFKGWSPWHVHRARKRHIGPGELPQEDEPSTSSWCLFQRETLCFQEIFQMMLWYSTIVDDYFEVSQPGWRLWLW